MFILIGLVRIVDTSNSKQSTKFPRMALTPQKTTLPSVFIDSNDWSPLIFGLPSCGASFRQVHRGDKTCMPCRPRSCVTGGTKNGDFLMGKPILLPIIYIYIYILMGEARCLAFLSHIDIFMGEPICFGFPKIGDRRIVMFRKIGFTGGPPIFFCERNPIWYEFFEDSTIYLRELQYLTVFLATKRSNFQETLLLKPKTIPRSTGGLEGPTLQKPPVFRISKSNSAGTTAMRNGHCQQKANNGIWNWSYLNRTKKVSCGCSLFILKSPKISTLVAFTFRKNHLWRPPCQSCWIWTILRNPTRHPGSEDPTLQPLVFQNAQGLHSRRWCPDGPWCCLGVWQRKGYILAGAGSPVEPTLSCCPSTLPGGTGLASQGLKGSWG